ncbi:Integrator complex subunit 6-A [Toxocara canis]|uniref:Integrator complex subunit 6-A n=1 Tax=Toxocara canis TaxID=6265 RepID=A0A0B2V0T3_TOXCA|nr:Integrator complex subunit 6-A [Toxocara canis]
MTIVLFLIDSSASMAQKTYQGTTILDTARSAVEQFLKQRGRDAGARGDRYMLMSFEEFPMNVKADDKRKQRGRASVRQRVEDGWAARTSGLVLAGWREGQAIFHEQLKALRPRGTTTFGAALGSAFRFVNVNRLQTGIDNYGCGRIPFFLEPVVIISITDGGCLTCPTSGVVSEIKFAKPTAIGNELTEEPFRWDQRLFALVLRLGGATPSTKVTAGMNLPSDSSPIDAMCVATGGRSFCVTSHKMLPMCIDAIVQKMQQQGALVQFEKIGPDPPPSLSDRVNGAIENGISKRNGEMDGMKKPVVDEGWRSLLTMVFARSASRTYLGHWPIPEAFWPDKSMMSLPPRKAHPVLMFRCDNSEPLVCQEFPFDKYELDHSPLSQFILERKQPNVCWQVFMMNSGMPGSSPAPFGYLKAATNLQSVNLFVMPYNYPVLLPLVEELKQDPRARTSQSWRLRLEKYLATVPSYYIQPLKKAFARMNIANPMMESEQAPQYSYNVLTYLAKMKHTAREEFESHCASVAAALQQSAPPPVPQVSVPRRAMPKGTEQLASRSKKKLRRVCASEVFPGYQVQVGEPNVRLMPSMKFRNPFEIPRSQLIEQVEKMRVNLALHLRDTNVSALVGGRPGMSIKLQHAEDLHNLPVGEMGNYQEYVKGLEATGRGPPREVEPQAIRAHAFGNPFKIDKKSIAVDEVGEGNLLGGANKGDGLKKRSNGNGMSTVTSEVSRPPRRKPGPLARNALSQWRRRRREWSMSSAGSTVSSTSDLDTASSLNDDLSSIASTSSMDIMPSSPSGSASSDTTGALLNGHAREKRVLERSASRLAPPPKKSCLKKGVAILDFKVLCERKRQLSAVVRRRLTVSETMTQVRHEMEGLCVVDGEKCFEYALKEATRYKRDDLVETIKAARKKGISDTAANGPT